ncbi:PREDICTED: uncharacterized protein LOC105559958 isoform X2 [Vollenhovia emeryi]|uniref:uncharacterized protein LOC105559958 isoform X2 n=1 Tax=Vollenhovia emeryi TaxID=411798 RepID=UPI0005F55C6A|nr:PREDICTED: uncharacterized protein LOC105559958 isoform X2 [Vollenhovia emeryi]
MVGSRNLCKSACTKSQRLPVGMDFFDNEYYITRQLMESIGLWPYEKRERRIVRMLCILVLYIQSLVIQLAVFITHEYSATLFINATSFSFLCVVYLLKYNTVYFNSNHVKNLFDQIQCDWKLIENMDELKIIKKYAYKTKLWAIATTSPLDEPRQRKFPIQVELFVDQERYFYHVSVFFIILAFVGMTILMATENMYMIFIQHSCALFELISFRLTCAFDTDMSKTTPSKTKCKLCTKLLSALNTHQHCLKFIETMQHNFAMSYFFLFVVGVASASVNSYRFIDAVTVHDILEAILSGLFVYAHVCYGIFMGHFGQDIINHSEYFFQQIYSTQWYTAPVHAQKLLLMTLRQSAKSSKIMVGGLFVISLEGLATLISMTMSYCMVLYSVRK